eukprot:2475367-Heterocapsa_arctica.AAC.1
MSGAQPGIPAGFPWLAPRENNIFDPSPLQGGHVTVPVRHVLPYGGVPGSQERSDRCGRLAALLPFLDSRCVGGHFASSGSTTAGGVDSVYSFSVFTAIRAPWPLLIAQSARSSSSALARAVRIRAL